MLILAVSELMKVIYSTITLHFIHLPSKTEGTQAFIPLLKWLQQLEMEELQRKGWINTIFAGLKGNTTFLISTGYAQESCSAANAHLN